MKQIKMLQINPDKRTTYRQKWQEVTVPPYYYRHFIAIAISGLGRSDVEYVPKK